MNETAEDTPKVSIVTPSFNQAAFLEKTILSVLGQDYPNLEYIIVDGGSTDGSVEIIKRYADRLVWWVSEKDEGQCQAINKGFAQASGDIFNWLNSDDKLMPAATRIAVSYLNRFPNIGVVYGDNIIIDQSENIVQVQQLPPHWPRALPYHLRIPQETVFIRRTHWEEACGLDESLHFGLDIELFLRLSKTTSFRHIPFVMGAAHQHPSCKTYQARSSGQRGHPELDKIAQQYGHPRFHNTLRKLCKRINKVRATCYLQSRSRRKEVSRLLSQILAYSLSNPSLARRKS